jgi:hypothetical protein
MSANCATLYIDSTNQVYSLFIEPTTAKVNQMYLGTTDNGTAISSYWYSKSFTESMPENLKIYYDSTFMFGSLNGTVNISKIYDDAIYSATVTLSQNHPQGGCGRDACGRMPAGDSTNTITVVQVANIPQRLKAKGKNFSVQYLISSTNDWRLDGIAEYAMPLDHFVFPSQDKIS